MLIAQSPKICVPEKTKIKDTHFELLRVICLIMIIIHHSIVHSTITNVSLLNEYAINIINIACIIAVNCFVMITGYYMVTSKIKLRKLLALELQMIFYGLLSFLILAFFKGATFEQFLQSLFPFITGSYWFMTAYIALYLLIPFINKLVSTLTKKQYLIFLLILVVLLSIVYSIYPSNHILEANRGYSLIWFIFLYLLAGYIRLYFHKKVNSFKLLFIYFTMVILQVQLMNLYSFINNVDYLRSITSYNSIFTLIASISFFLLFKNLKIKNRVVNNIILFFSPLTLGVYLIHDNFIVRDFLWNNGLFSYFDLPFFNMIIILLGQTIIIFVICCCIEKIRQIIWSKLEKISFIRKLLLMLNTFEMNFNITS